jgi:hypothetical protein
MTAQWGRARLRTLTLQRKLQDVLGQGRNDFGIGRTSGRDREFSNRSWSIFEICFNIISNFLQDN